MYLDPNGHRPISQTGDGTEGPDKKYADKMRNKPVAKKSTKPATVVIPKKQPVIKVNKKTTPVVVNKKKATNEITEKDSKNQKIKTIWILIKLKIE